MLVFLTFTIIPFLEEQGNLHCIPNVGGESVEVVPFAEYFLNSLSWNHIRLIHSTGYITNKTKKKPTLLILEDYSPQKMLRYLHAQTGSGFTR